MLLPMFLLYMHVCCLLFFNFRNSFGIDMLTFCLPAYDLYFHLWFVLSSLFLWILKILFFLKEKAILIMIS